MEQLLTIIIVAYNSANVIARCIEALPEGVRVIVIDNNSHDESSHIALRYPKVEVVKNSNTGYGKAANIGLAMVKTPYALLLNPDVLLAKESAQALVHAAQKNPAIGLLGGRMFYEEDGGRIYQNQLTFNEAGLAYSHWISGAAMLFNMSMLAKVGVFDENFFLFYEETDLCGRFTQAGYLIAVLQAAEAQHAAGQSSGGSLRVARIRAWHVCWSRGYYHSKHFGRLRAARTTLSKCFKSLIYVVANALRFRKRELLISGCEFLGGMAFLLGFSSRDTSGRAWFT